MITTPSSSRISSHNKHPLHTLLPFNRLVGAHESHLGLLSEDRRLQCDGVVIGPLGENSKDTILALSLGVVDLLVLVLNSPRSGLVDGVSIDVQPLSQLEESLLHDRNDTSIGSRTDIQQLRGDHTTKQHTMLPP